MSFLTPITALIAAGITVPILVAMYFLKLRRKQMVVSSTLLWKKTIQDLQVNAPFQKMRRNLLLLLQLLILAALLLAFARPTTRTTAQPGQRVVIMIDHSASMNATDVDPTRLDEAKRAAIELVDNLETGANAMVVSFADRPRALTRFISDPSRLRAAIRGIEPTDQPGRLAEALRVIEPEALEAEASDGQALAVYVLSDGKVQLPADETLALRGAELTFVKVGSDQPDNLGIVAFSARRDFEKPRVVQVFASLQNSGPDPVTTNLTLSLDDQIAQVQPVEIDAGSTRSVQFDFVAPGAAMVELRHDHADALAADDVARIMLAPAKRLRVLFVGQPNAYIERGLKAAGVRELVRMSGEKYENQDPELLRSGGWDTSDVAAVVSDTSGEGFDVILFDGYSPKSVPPVSSLSFGSAPPIPGLAIRPTPAEAPEAEAVLDWSRDDPLMRYVVLDDVVLSRPGRLVLPDDATVLATGASGPILAELPGEGGRHVVASFDVLNTNWPLYVSFPVFLNNAVQTLGLGGLADEAGVAYRTGQVAVVPVADDSQRVSYSGPVSMDKPVRGREATLDAFARVGVYETSDAVPVPFDRLPVNLLDEVESDLRPAELLEIGSIAAQGEARTAVIRREVWPWFAWAALAVLLVEWLVYTRRMRV